MESEQYNTGNLAPSEVCEHFGSSCLFTPPD